MMKNISKYFLAAIFSGIMVFASCTKTELDDEPAQKMYYSYYPLQTGNWYEYELDSIKFDPFYNNGTGRWDTIKYQMRVEIDSTITDNEGQNAFKVLRYYRNNSSEGWRLPHVDVAKRTDKGIEIVKDNNRYLSLTFPVEKDRSWDGNIYNSIERKDEFNYHYTDVHRSLNLNDKHFDSSLTVELIDVNAPIERYYIFERYAAKVGLVYRQQIDTNRFNTVNNKSILNGYIIKQSLVSYNVR